MSESIAGDYTGPLQTAVKENGSWTARCSECGAVVSDPWSNSPERALIYFGSKYGWRYKQGKLFCPQCVDALTVKFVPPSYFYGDIKEQPDFQGAFKP